MLQCVLCPANYFLFFKDKRELNSELLVNGERFFYHLVVTKLPEAADSGELSIKPLPTTSIIQSCAMNRSNAAEVSGSSSDGLL